MTRVAFNQDFVVSARYAPARQGDRCVGVISGARRMAVHKHKPLTALVRQKHNPPAFCFLEEAQLTPLNQPYSHFALILFLEAWD